MSRRASAKRWLDEEAAHMFGWLRRLMRCGRRRDCRLAVESLESRYAPASLAPPLLLEPPTIDAPSAVAPLAPAETTAVTAPVSALALPATRLTRSEFDRPRPASASATFPSVRSDLFGVVDAAMVQAAVDFGTADASEAEPPAAAPPPPSVWLEPAPEDGAAALA
jgi:hypothetical protein